MKVFLLEENDAFRVFIGDALRKQGFQVTCCCNPETAMDAIYEERFTFYLIDIDANETGGFELLQYLRETEPNRPAIVFSTHTGIGTIKKAFALGCNDYLKKPFDFEELLVRMEHLGRIINGSRNSDLLQLTEEYSYSLQNSELFHQGRQITLSKVESRLFHALAKNMGNVVDTDYLREHVWGNEEISSSTIRYSVHRLTKKLASELIVNHRGIGYSLQRADTRPASNALPNRS